ncbi:RICIN domain-containing protein [Streptomyces sp. NPDC051183]|uniref:RICIN domain-containing protein n=1 Tax=Streptomyces sp. NPDC051183 TaxID=3155165 RepID=UPI003445098F
MLAAVAAVVAPLVAASPVQAEAEADQFNIEFLNLKTGKCVDVPGVDPPTQGSTLQQWGCLPGWDDNQGFDLIHVTSDYFVIRSTRSPGLCLDLPGTGDPGRSAIGFYPCRYNTSDNQLWVKQPWNGGGYAPTTTCG